MTDYSRWDVTLILLREGLEALLVVIALLTFLDKRQAPAQKIWVWLGSLLGLGAALVTAIAVGTVFRQVVTHTRQEWVEGVTGLVAAALLMSISVWMHRQAAVRSWQDQLKTQAESALATGRMLSLSLLAFTAVFREGAETLLFVLGIMPGMAPSELWMGIGQGSLLVAVVGVGLRIAGGKMPLGLLFRSLGWLLFLLAVKFLGSGLHALQVAQVLTLHPLLGIPTWRLLSFYPTWETALPQLGVLILGLWTVWVGLERRTMFPWRRSPNPPS
ncbi:MAG: hypothetical protein OHK0012_28470 [Synechococcales cyanobacterium]